MSKLDALNCASAEDAVVMLTPMIERAPDVAALVAERRPFTDVAALCKAIHDALLSLEEPQRIRLFQAHPKLMPEDPLAMTPASQFEQERLELTTAGNAYRSKFDTLNRRYQEKFGFPFITALVRHADTESVIADFETRLAASRSDEVNAAIEQIAAVSASRVSAIFGESKVTGQQISQTRA